LSEVLSVLDVLRRGGVEVAFKPPPQTAVPALLALTGGDAALVDAPAAVAKKPLKELTSWLTEFDRTALDSYRQWMDAILPDLDGAEALAGELAEIDSRVATKIRGLVYAAKAKRHSLPGSIAEIEDVRRIAADLETAAQSFAPTEEIRQFLREMLGGGAPLDLLTEAVQTWATERGFWSSMRVRLGDR
jgi:hypothetical protein